MCSSSSINWIELFAPSLPSTVAIVAGFYAFHYFAVKRQKRQEIFEESKKLHNLVDECIEIAKESWKVSGKRAVEAGKVMHLRGKLMQLSTTAENLVEKQKRFGELNACIRAFRKAVDEEIDDQGKPLTTIDDQTRTESRMPFEAFESSLKIRRTADRVFNRCYK